MFHTLRLFLVFGLSQYAWNKTAISFRICKNNDLLGKRSGSILNLKFVSTKSPSLGYSLLSRDTPLHAKQPNENGHLDEFSIKKLRDNVYIIVPFVSIVSLFGGVSFFVIRENWNLHTSFYYTTQALFGLMQNVPALTSYTDKLFALSLKVWGELLVAGAIGALSTSLVDGMVANSRKKLKTMDSPVDTDGDGQVDMFELFDYYKNNFLVSIGWEENKPKHLTTLAATLLWGMGILYCIVYEGFDLPRSMYFSLSQLSAAGTVTPVCEGEETNCDIGMLRGILNSLFLWFGHPVFVYVIGQFAGIVVEEAVLEQERAKMRKPLTNEEYNFVVSINGVAQSPCRGTIDLPEFVIMQLMRLGRLSKDEISDITSLFQSLDKDGSGEINRQEVLKRNLIVSSAEQVMNTDPTAAFVLPFRRDVSGQISQSEQQSQDLIGPPASLLPENNPAAVRQEPPSALKQESLAMKRDELGGWSEWAKWAYGTDEFTKRGGTANSMPTHKVRPGKPVVEPDAQEISESRR